jgi:tRNA (cmo5U34)-methyltransferase
MSTKSSVDDIRRRFDGDVERFSNLQTGQSATIDAPLVLELVTEAAAASTPQARAVLDVGCGAGNYTLKLLERLPGLDVTLLDLSRPMLDRAVERVSAATRGKVTAVQGDVRQADLPTGGYDVILAAAVLHHLRGDAEWKGVFSRFHRLLRPGGSVWISDLVRHDNPAVQAAMWRRYGEYLVALKGEPYRDEVFAYVEREDTPRSLTYQVELLRKSGFVQVDVLHKNNCFAAFGGLRSRRKVERE